jgi:hypothetical protein
LEKSSSFRSIHDAGAVERRGSSSAHRIDLVEISSALVSALSTLIFVPSAKPSAFVIAYCFATRADAEFVQLHFGGEFVDRSNLGRWSRVNGG